MRASLAFSFLLLASFALFGKANARVIEDSAQNPKPRAEIRFLFRHFIPDSFRAVSFDSSAINIYREDVSKFRDTFALTLNAPERGFAFTFPIQGRVTSGFGPRRFYGHVFHFGTDISCHKGDTIVAALPGTVRVARYDRGYGYFIVVSHSDGLETLYGHLSEILVTPGQEVASGQLIGKGGSTGLSTGPHLHFEFRFLGQQFDPSRVLSFADAQVVMDTMDIDASWFGHIQQMRMARYHTIRRGDTLGHIARRYGTSITRLCRINRMGTRSLLRPGRRLRVA